MASYVAALRGYIADVPQFFFKRFGDGRVFVNKHVTQCSLNPQTDFQEVRAGWSNYACAYLPGQATMDVQITMGDFDAEMFAMANAEAFEEDAGFETYVTESLKPDATTHKVTLTYTPVADSVYIHGLAADTTAAAGKYVVDTENKTIEFAADETAEMEISYKTVAADAQVINITNQKVACGETVLKWPIYGDNKDCSESGIIKYLVVRIFKTRVTTLPGFDTSFPERAWAPCTVRYSPKCSLTRWTPCAVAAA